MDLASDPEATQRTFSELFKIFIEPEVLRRQNEGLLPRPFPLRAAQVLLYGDERPIVVRLNTEVRALASMKLVEGVAKQAGEPVLASELARVDEIRLTDDDDPNAGHITVLLIGDRWHLAFDFRRNKELSRRHIERAREFHQAATTAEQAKTWAVVVDTLFSAAELAAKALLLLMPDPKFAKKASHQGIQTKYQEFGRLNVDPAFIEALNKLSGWRNAYRYMKSELVVDVETIAGTLVTVERMIDDAEMRATHRVSADRT